MQSISQWFINNFVPAFGRTLVHSLWQGMAAAVVAGLVIAFTRKSSAVKRYNGLLAVYALFLIVIATSFFYELGSSAAIANTELIPASQPTAIVIIENGVASNKAIEQSLMSNILSFVNDNAPFLVSLWALLFIAQLTRMALGLRYVQSVRTKGTSCVTEEWTKWINEMSSRLGIRQTVVLLQSKKIKVPVALGILKPVVLVPVGLLTQLTTQQVEAVLLHELAHIHRKDYLVNLMQSFADAVFFFNPSVRWISARIREERETCCDDAVVQHTANKKDYVEALVSFSQMPLSSSYAMAIGSNKNHLLSRVKTIITRENSRLSAREQATLMLGMMAILAIGFLAFKPKEEVKTKTKTVENKSAAAKYMPLIFTPTHVAYEINSLAKKINTDTIPPQTTKPEPVKWKNVSTNINDDGEGKTMQMLATAEDGTSYRIRKVDGKIVLLNVNGKEVAEKDYPQYESIIDALEEKIKKSKADALKAQEHQSELLFYKHEALKQHQAALQDKQEALKKHLSKLPTKEQWYYADSLSRLKHQKDIEHTKEIYKNQSHEYNQQNKLAYNLNLENYNENKKLFNQDRLNKHNLQLHTNANLLSIISDLLSSKLAGSETTLSFTLTATELVVNGKTIDKDIFEIFKKKYIKSSADSYSYERNGNTTRTTINLQ